MQKHLIYILQTLSILLYSYKFWSTVFVAYEYNFSLTSRKCWWISTNMTDFIIMSLF